MGETSSALAFPGAVEGVFFSTAFSIEAISSFKGVLIPSSPRLFAAFSLSFATEAMSSSFKSGNSFLRFSFIMSLASLGFS